MAVGPWTEWSQYILHEIERQDACIKVLEEKHLSFRDCMKKENAKLKLEQAKIKTKIAVIVAILTTVGNGILYGVVKVVWPLIFG